VTTTLRTVAVARPARGNRLLRRLRARKFQRHLCDEVGRRAGSYQTGE
jgi:hypothetical protein